jgi:hypothetical protein
MSEHAPLPPSSAKEWSKCLGWLAHNAGIVDSPTDEAAWGDEAHDWAERGLHSIAQARHPELPDDPEMAETVKMYVDHCGDLMHAHRVYGGDNLGIEAKLSTTIHEQVWGTGDFYLYAQDINTLYIRDFKSGRLEVDPDDPQLLLYAEGVITKLGLADTGLMLDVGVVQPRAYARGGPIRTYRVYAHNLRAEFNHLRNAASGNINGGPTQAGPHCLNCSARTRCESAIKHGAKLYYASSESVPEDVTPVEAGLLHKQAKQAAKHLTKMAEAYEALIVGRLNAGDIVPGWSLGSTYARSEDWTKDADDVRNLGMLFGVSLDKPAELLTPAQARKTAIPAEVINDYCTRRKTGVKLIESSEGDLQQIFGDLSNE